MFSRDARARAVQLSCYDEAICLPNAWSQQASIRVQQLIQHETDLLEYGEDPVAGAPFFERLTGEFIDAAWEEIEWILSMGGSTSAIESGQLAGRLHESCQARVDAIEQGSWPKVGVNLFEASEASPLAEARGDIGHLADPELLKRRVQEVQALRSRRNAAEASAALQALEDAVTNGDNIMPPSIRCAHAGVTTGEWSELLRKHFGTYRAPIGLDKARLSAESVEGSAEQRERVSRISEALGSPLKVLIAKVGLDGHQSGAEVIAGRLRAVGVEVVHPGIRWSAGDMVTAALSGEVHAVGLSMQSGAHLELVPEFLEKLGAANIPVVLGGTIPPEHHQQLYNMGVKLVATPKNYKLTEILDAMFDVIVEHFGLSA